MRVYTREVNIPKHKLCLEFLLTNLIFNGDQKLIKFVVVGSDSDRFNCEIDLIESEMCEGWTNEVFDYKIRGHENIDKFNAVLLIPTGINAVIGGHCGDGNVVARLISSACDTLITHPNVVNASDINELPEKDLYVEGSVITRLLMGQIRLQKVRSNKVLMLMDRHSDRFFNNEIVNMVSSARIAFGMDCDVREMDSLIESTSCYSGSGRVTGSINNVQNLFKIINEYRYRYEEIYSAVGLSTFINVENRLHKDYFLEDIINPWGGIEAMITHTIAQIYNIPCAHAPMMTSREIMGLELGIVDPRKASESTSVTYLYSVLKGLHRSPKIVKNGKGLGVEDVSCLIIPDGCIGLPVLACLEQKIPVIAVRENKSLMKNDLRELPSIRNKIFIVETYLEAVGVMHALKQGIEIGTVKRPMEGTKVIDHAN